jgi:hypothetical protein
LAPQVSVDGRLALFLLLEVLASRYDPADHLRHQLLDIALSTKDRLVSSSSTAESSGRRKITLIPQVGVNETHCIFGTSAMLGRAATCDFAFPQASRRVSNWHARIHYLARVNEYWIQDNGSANGTFVDGKEIHQATRLTLGARVQLSSALNFLFEHDSQDPLGSGSLIYLAPNGKELARYIIAPRGEAWCGNRPGNAIRLPFLKNAIIEGRFICEDDEISFAYSKDDKHPVRIDDAIDIDFAFVNIHVKVS